MKRAIYTEWVVLKDKNGAGIDITNKLTDIIINSDKYSIYSLSNEYGYYMTKTEGYPDIYVTFKLTIKNNRIWLIKLSKSAEYKHVSIIHKDSFVDTDGSILPIGDWIVTYDYSKVIYNKQGVLYIIRQVGDYWVDISVDYENGIQTAYAMLAEELHLSTIENNNKERREKK